MHINWKGKSWIKTIKLTKTGESLPPLIGLHCLLVCFFNLDLIIIWLNTDTWLSEPRPGWWELMIPTSLLPQSIIHLFKISWHETPGLNSPTHTQPPTHRTPPSSSSSSSPCSTGSSPSSCCVYSDFFFPRGYQPASVNTRESLALEEMISLPSLTPDSHHQSSPTLCFPGVFLVILPQIYSTSVLLSIDGTQDRSGGMMAPIKDTWTDLTVRSPSLM